MQQKPISAPSQGSGASRVGWWIVWVLSIGLLAFLIVELAIRFTTPVPLYRLRVIQDISLPSVLHDPKDPVVPGLAVRFDHFDFQALDPQTHLLFIAHSGPIPDKLMQVDHNFTDADVAKDGNVVVFDTQQRKVVKLLPIPQTSGVAVAPDIHWAYVSDDQYSIVWGIDEQTFRMVPIKLDPLDSPDAMAYDPVDHRMFVSDPGIANPKSSDMNIALVNQNVAVIDVIHNTLVTKVPIGIHKPFGDDVGHVDYDSTSHRVFVVTLPLHNQNPPFPDHLVLPPVTSPSFIDVIDPTLSIPRVVSQIKLLDTCVGPHGFVIDSDQEIGFVACATNNRLMRVNLRTMQPDTQFWQLPFKVDILRLDHRLHILFVACGSGIAMFDESGGKLTSLGSQFVGGNSNHTVAINENTQELYVPLPNVGDRPVLRILQYIPSGTEPNAAG